MPYRAESRGELCSPVFICYELTGDRRSPLRVDIEFNLIAAVNNYVFVSLFGGSKPPPYRVEYKFTFTDNRILLLFCNIPCFVRRDIFAFAKVILCRRHSDIIFAFSTDAGNITRLKAEYHCVAIELAVRRI